MPSATAFGYTAGGNISPAVFVMFDSTSWQVIQATAGAQLIGISQRGTRNAPYSTLDDGYAAISGETLRIFVSGEVCGLTLGGTVTVGDRLKATTGGVGITASTGEAGAVALQSGVSGDIIEVVVLQPIKVS